MLTANQVTCETTKSNNTNRHTVTNRNRVGGEIAMDPEKRPSFANLSDDWHLLENLIRYSNYCESFNVPVTQVAQSLAKAIGIQSGGKYNAIVYDYLLAIPEHPPTVNRKKEALQVEGFYCNMMCYKSQLFGVIVFPATDSVSFYFPKISSYSPAVQQLIFTYGNNVLLRLCLERRVLAFDFRPKQTIVHQIPHIAVKAALKRKLSQNEGPSPALAVVTQHESNGGTTQQHKRQRREPLNPFPEFIQFKQAAEMENWQEVATVSGNVMEAVKRSPLTPSHPDLPKDENKLKKWDKMHLLEIFPEKIWRMILDNVKLPDDVESISNASPYFSELLEEQKKLYLFSKVVEVLAPRYDERKEGFESVADLLNCRLVCSAWNQAVEDYYQSPMAGNSRMSDDMKISSDQPDRYGWANDVFSFPGKLNDFVNYFDLTHYLGVNSAPKNPLIRRSVTFENYCLDPNGTGPSLAYTTGILNMLTKFGREIWYCSILLEDTSLGRVQNYTKLREMLELVPNLKALNIECKSRGYYCDDIQLELDIQLNPLPKLGKLETLKVNYIPISVFNALVSQNNHITGLEVRPLDYTRGTFEIFATILMPNLMELYVNLEHEKDYRTLLKYGAAWNLEKLCLHCLFPQPNELEGRQFFKSFGVNWGSTLTSLVLEVPVPRFKSSEINLLEAITFSKVDLPYLRQLKVIY